MPELSATAASYFKISRLPRPGIAPHGDRYQGGYFSNSEVVGMLELRIANASDALVENESSQSRGKLSKKQDSSFFTPVSNSVLTASCLTTKARQILLMLELRAGASRIAKLSNKEIARLTGYQRRTVERSLNRLRKQERIVQVEAGVIRLCNPIPSDKYVPVYDSVVYHPVWQDWQKHVLLFLMSQFRGRDQEFGVNEYALNLYGRQKLSIERACRIPGRTKERREKFREFIEQLQSDRILRIVDSATSNRPAICVIDRDALEQLRPDYDRHAAATFRMTVSGKKTHRHTSRSNTVTRHVASRHPSRSNTVIPHAATPSSVTYEKDSEDSEDSEKILESPRSAFGGRGAISSRSKLEASIADPEVNNERTESDGHELPVGDRITLLMKLPLHRELTKEVERRCCGTTLCESRADSRLLAKRWAVLLEELPDDLDAEDVELAIRSKGFQGLNSMSWGLLLSDSYFARFAVAIREQYEKRKRLVQEADDSYQRLLQNLSSDEVASRLAALERLATLGKSKPKACLRIAKFLTGKDRDPESTVRFLAVQKLAYLVQMKLVPDAYRQAIYVVTQKTLCDEDCCVREEAEYLLGVLDETTTSS